MMKQVIQLAAVIGTIIAPLTVPSGAASPDWSISFPLTPLKVQVQAAERERGEIPTELTISSLDLDIAVKPAAYDGSSWQFYEDAVSYWIESARPGESGNIVIYAHRKTHFRRLFDAKIGGTVTLSTVSGRRMYAITQFRVVAPSQVEVFAPTGSEQLTLLTCTNEDDADRLVIIAEPSDSFSHFLQNP